MTDKKPKFNIKGLEAKGQVLLRQVGKYKLALFIIFVAAIYGFVWLKISSYSGIQPSTSQVTSQVQASQIPRINPSVVNQLQSLQDNSVSVQSLFNQARNNPFQ